MAYLRIHPIDPGMERMLAKIAHTVAACAGNELDEAYFGINTVKEPAKEAPDGAAFADLLRARVKANTQK